MFIILWLGSDLGSHLFAVMVRFHQLIIFSSCFDYCDVVWCPTTAKLTSLIERVHSKLVNRLSLPFRSKFSYSLIERRRFHTSIQIFKSIHQSSPSYLHNIFHFSKDITGHVS